ncbi:MAG: flagellar biosynthetic protein FliR, partial [Planctomycetes bacterium]|nr:flagellar biosynthetic protein FliR [Planctomycetota bacterium]
MLDLSSLSDLYSIVIPGTVIFSRIVGLFVSAPIIGGKFAPMRVKAMLALAITICILPQHIGQIPSYVNNDWGFFMVIIREFMVGATMGILMNL